MVNKNQIISQIKKIVKRDMQKHKYHNYKHALFVYKMVSIYGPLEKIKPNDLFLLKIAALLHDVIYVPFRKDNEIKSAVFASKLLSKLNFNLEDISIVKQLIIATTFPTNAKTKLEQIICDADISVVGCDNYFKVTEQLRKEWGLSKKDFFVKNQSSFFNNFKWYTPSANKLGRKHFLKNKKQVFKIIKSYSK